jgi:hypothetical protein
MQKTPGAAEAKPAEIRRGGLLHPIGKIRGGGCVEIDEEFVVDAPVDPFLVWQVFEKHSDGFLDAESGSDKFNTLAVGLDFRVLLEGNPENEWVAGPMDRVGLEHVLENGPSPIMVPSMSAVHARCPSTQAA